MTAIPLVSIVTFLPGLAGLVLLVVPRLSTSVLRAVSLAVAVVTFVLSLPLYFGFDPEIIGYQFEESLRWMPTFGVSYHVGIDGISLPLFVLTFVLSFLCAIYSWRVVPKPGKTKAFIGLMKMPLFTIQVNDA